MKPALNDAATPATTAEWTPSKWSLVDIDNKPYKMLRLTSPLDDEQGTGVADAERALIQYNGGAGTTDSGKKAPGNVGKIGWNVDKLKLGAEGVAGKHEYALNFAVTQGDMITATLTWDRLRVEVEGDAGDPDWKVEKGDDYGKPSASPEENDGIADFNLKVQYKGITVAESIAPPLSLDKGDTVEHIHFPAPEDGVAGDYKIIVELKQHAAGADKDHPYAVAWWA